MAVVTVEYMFADVLVHIALYPVGGTYHHLTHFVSMLMILVDIHCFMIVTFGETLYLPGPCHLYVFKLTSLYVRRHFFCWWAAGYLTCFFVKIYIQRTSMCRSDRL
jgi:hypothetical protein